MISKIMEIHPKNRNIKKLVILEKSVSFSDLMELYSEFDYDKAKIEKSIGMYRDVGLVLELRKADESLPSGWKDLIREAFPKKEAISKLDNIFVNNDCSKLLLITNKRLMKADIERVNEKIRNINYEIASYNEEWVKQHPAEQKIEKKGFFSRIFG